MGLVDGIAQDSKIGVPTGPDMQWNNEFAGSWVAEQHDKGRATLRQPLYSKSKITRNGRLLRRNKRNAKTIYSSSTSSEAAEGITAAAEQNSEAKQQRE